MLRNLGLAHFFAQEYNCLTRRNRDGMKLHLDHPPVSWWGVKKQRMSSASQLVWCRREGLHPRKHTDPLSNIHAEKHPTDQDAKWLLRDPAAVNLGPSETRKTHPLYYRWTSMLSFHPLLFVQAILCNTKHSVFFKIDRLAVTLCTNSCPDNTSNGRGKSKSLEKSRLL